MADSSKTSLLKISMNHTKFNSLKLHTNAHAVANGTTDFHVPISIAQNPDEYVHKAVIIRD